VLGVPFRRLDSLYEFAKASSFLTKTNVIPARRLPGPAREGRFAGRMAFWRGTT
jgi:hypothetical protein